MSLGGPAAVRDWVDLNVSAPLFPLTREVLDVEPWETEAYFLTEPLQWW